MSSSPTAKSPAAGVGNEHDHGDCVASLVARARRAFGDRQLKLTALRLAVLEEIAASHDAVGAYDVIDRLARKSGTKLAPISVYRAIDALLEAGLVHRLESRNAFFACHAPHKGEQRHIAFLCENCARVVEAPVGQIYRMVEAAGRTLGFEVHSAMTEAVGRCRACAASTKPRDGEAA